MCMLYRQLSILHSIDILNFKVCIFIYSKIIFVIVLDINEILLEFNV